MNLSISNAASIQHSRRISVGAYLRLGLIGGALIGVLLPAMIRSRFFFNDPTGSFYNSLWATSIALVSAFYLYNKFIAYPSRTSYSHVLPVFGTVYAIMLAVLVMFRIEYSRYQLLMSFFFSAAWVYGLIFLGNRAKKILVGMVPGGSVSQLEISKLIEPKGIQSAEIDPTSFDAIVADFRADHNEEWERYLAEAALSGIPVYHVKHFTELTTGCVQLEHLSENSFGTIMPSHTYAKVKRLIDLALAVVVAPLFFAVMLIAAILIKLTSRGPVFFLQERMGFRGKPFRIIKLRTMRAPQKGGGQDGHSFTVDNDPRVTKVGAVLRKFRIDEFPQIFNIVAGQMSWIGPRPEAVDLSEDYQSAIPFYSYRHIVRPGITGWAQVNQGNVFDVEAATTKLHYDFYYIKYFSPWLDLMITVKTLAIMATGFGSR